MRRPLLLATAAIVLPLLAGCVRPANPLPTYSRLTDAAALDLLAARGHAVKSVSAACLLTLTRPDGQSVRLDGALVLSPADRSVRLRAWKFGQAVFDLTLTPSGLWIETPRDARQRSRVLPASLSAAQLARAMSLFDGDVFEGPGVAIVGTAPATLRVRKTLEDCRSMTAQVDRPTLTVRQYELTDSGGGRRFALALSQYGIFSGIAWPTRLVADSDGGRIEVELRDVEINSELSPGAFVPPHGAEKLP